MHDRDRAFQRHQINKFRLIPMFHTISNRQFLSCRSCRNLVDLVKFFSSDFDFAPAEVVSPIRILSKGVSGWKIKGAICCPGFAAESFVVTMRHDCIEPECPPYLTTPSQLHGPKARIVIQVRPESLLVLNGRFFAF